MTFIAPSSCRASHINVLLSSSQAPSLVNYCKHTEHLRQCKQVCEGSAPRTHPGSRSHSHSYLRGIPGSQNRPDLNVFGKGWGGGEEIHAKFPTDAGPSCREVTVLTAEPPCCPGWMPAKNVKELLWFKLQSGVNEIESGVFSPTPLWCEIELETLEETVTNSLTAHAWGPCALAPHTHTCGKRSRAHICLQTPAWRPFWPSPLRKSA